MEVEADEYITALLAEIDASWVDSSILQTVYIGGGTPTVLAAAHLSRVLDALKHKFRLSLDAETTVEANPGTVDNSYLRSLLSAGFNRLSIGVQSFDDGTLKQLGRIHSADEALSAFETARNVGFTNIGIDLMYALPEQTLSNWQSTLNTAIALRPEHVSLYELTVEEGTPFGDSHSKSQLVLPDEDLQIEMYQAAINTLTSVGYEQYEISNFALAGRRSRHNQVYWRNDPYYGFGAGATGYVNGTRYSNAAHPSEYISRMESSGNAVVTTENISGRRSMGETIMLGLRMLDGVDLHAFQERYSADLLSIYVEEVARFTRKGLLQVKDDHLQLTSSGLLLANEVSAAFL